MSRLKRKSTTRKRKPMHITRSHLEDSKSLNLLLGYKPTEIWKKVIIATSTFCMSATSPLKTVTPELKTTTKKSEATRESSSSGSVRAAMSTKALSRTKTALKSTSKKK